MYLEIYVDILFLINFCMDFILLKLCAKIQKLNCSNLRILVASAIGAVGSCIVAIEINMNVIFKFIFGVIGLCVLMNFIAFKFNKIKLLIKSSILMFILTWFLGGLVNSVYYTTNAGYYINSLISGKWIKKGNMVYIVIVTIIGGIIFTIWENNRNKSKRREELLYEVQLFYKGRTTLALGLLDTGNDLTEPITGSPVIIVEEEYMKKIILGVEEMLAVRIIPYHSIGCEKGILKGVVLDKIIINSLTCKDDEFKEKTINKVTAAIYKGKLSKQGDYQIILHKALL